MRGSGCEPPAHVRLDAVSVAAFALVCLDDGLGEKLGAGLARVDVARGLVSGRRVEQPGGAGVPS